MSAFTAADVKRLRDQTGAGMMDCKKALEEADGDFDRALEVLEAKGAAKVAKRDAERQAANGVVAAYDGALLELNCETDFVAKNEQFVALADKLVEQAKRLGVAGGEELLGSTLSDGTTVEHAITSVAATIGEKVALGRVAVLEGTTVTYLHRRDPQLPPQVGVVVAYAGADGAEAAAETARAVAMQIAAMRPRYVTREHVPAEVVEAKQAEFEQAAREEGKPEQIVPRIVEGKLKAYYKDAVLAEQASVHEDDLTVGQMLEKAGVTVTAFARFEVGEE